MPRSAVRTQTSSYWPLKSRDKTCDLSHVLPYENENQLCARTCGTCAHDIKLTFSRILYGCIYNPKWTFSDNLYITRCPVYDQIDKVPTMFGKVGFQLWFHSPLMFQKLSMKPKAPIIPCRIREN